MKTLPNNKGKRYTNHNMQGQDYNHFVGLDVGTESVKCVVGMLDVNHSGQLSIIGHGTSANLGMRRGSVVEPGEVADAISQAIVEANRIAGVEINRATVNVNGSHIQGVDSKGVIAVSAGDKEITPEDQQRVDEAAMAMKFPPNREIVQYFAKSYSLDGQRNIKQPVGMHGVRLEVEAHIVTGASPNIGNLNAALEQANILPKHLTLSSLASAEATLTRQQKEAGTLVLDIGAGTTNFIVVEDGEVYHIAVLPIGGMHLTNDLAIGLKTDLDVAEQTKLQHASLDESKKTTVNIKLNGKSHTFDHKEINMICEARIEELFEYVDKELARIRRSRKLPGGVVITGGTAKIPGIADYARDQLQLAARIGQVSGVTGLVDTVEDVSFTTAVGLMKLDMLLPSQESFNSSGLSANSALNSLQSLIKKFGS